MVEKVKTYEYKIIHVPNIELLDPKEINAYGKDGWRLVAIRPSYRKEMSDEIVFEKGKEKIKDTKPPDPSVFWNWVSTSIH